MNWEAIGSIAEAVSVVLVLVSIAKKTQWHSAETGFCQFWRYRCGGCLEFYMGGPVLGAVVWPSNLR